MRNELIDRIIRSFKDASNILITAHRDPDGDSLGSQLAMREFLLSMNKNVYICNEGTVPSRYLFMDNIDKVNMDCSEGDFKPDLAVSLEATSYQRMGHASKLIGPNCFVVNLDHHTGNTMYGDINYVDERASSVAEIVYRVLKQSGFTLTRSAAENLYIAILTDTGRFHFSSTTPESLRTCAELIEAGVDTREITDKIYYSKTESQLRVIGETIQNAEVKFDGRLCALTLSRDMLRRKNLDFGDFEGIVDYSMYLGDVVLGILFKDVSDNKTKVSLRSRSRLDVSALARHFGGGGHANAAGATIDEPLDKAKAIIYEMAGEMLNHHDK
jgi:phosphoesterase RecJ-like protein